MRSKAAFICGLFFFILVTAQGAFGQNGGKAEPNRIEFKPGTTSTIVNGSVRNDEEAEYVLSARRGQRLIIKLSNVPAKSSCFDLKGPENVDLGLEYDCNWTFSKPLPATGDYFISIGRPSQSKGTSRYKLLVTVK